ncbi:MAG: cytochrome c [Bacteroidota bacterium]
MKKFKIIFFFVSMGILTITLVNSCKTPQAILDKSGAQLWGENCARCHNTPSPAAYSDDQWDIITAHMKVKAGLTDVEVKKISTLLKSGN